MHGISGAEIKDGNYSHKQVRITCLLLPLLVAQRNYCFYWVVFLFKPDSGLTVLLYGS